MPQQIQVIDAVRAGEHPPTTDVTFTPAFGDATVNRCSNNSCNPAGSANRSSGTRPAADTKFGSSKTGRTV